MTCGGAAALALSSHPALNGRRCTLSLPVARRGGDRGDRGDGNEPQCSPNPPKWNWQACWSNCSQHYFLWQEILLSTNRGFNKLQEMRLQAVVKRLCLSSTVEVAVSTDALSLSPGLSPQSLFFLVLYLTHAFSSAILFLLLLFPHFRFNYFITCYIHVSRGLTCITPWSLSPLGALFYYFSCWLFFPEGENSITPTPSRYCPSSLLLWLFLCCQCGVVMLVLSWRISLIWASLMKK